MDIRKSLNHLNSQIGQTYDTGTRRLLDRMGYEPKRDSTETALFVLGGVGVGLAIGLSLGVLFAPKRGQETRGDIRHRLDDLRARGTTRYEEMRSHRLENGTEG